MRADAWLRRFRRDFGVNFLPSLHVHPSSCRDCRCCYYFLFATNCSASSANGSRSLRSPTQPPWQRPWQSGRHASSFRRRSRPRRIHQKERGDSSVPPSNQTLPFCFPRNGLCVLSSHSDPVSRKEYDLELLPVRIKPSVPQPPSVDQSQCTPRIWIYVCNCSLAIHINFVVSVGGFDVREKRCSRRTSDENFADQPPRADTKARDSTRRTGQLISLRLLPVLLLVGVRGTLWEKLATDKIGSRIIWSAAKNVTQDTLALTERTSGARVCLPPIPSEAWGNYQSLLHSGRRETFSQVVGAPLASGRFVSRFVSWIAVGTRQK